MGSAAIELGAYEDGAQVRGGPEEACFLAVMRRMRVAPFERPPLMIFHPFRL